MMNFYKRRAEQLEEENARLNKKLRDQYEEHRNEMGDLQQQLHDQIHINHHFAQVNLRTTEIANRKHQAGLRLAHCIDELVGAIELVEETQMSDDLGVKYICMQRDAMAGRVDSALQLLIGNTGQTAIDRWEGEIADTLLAREVIDLTGEETEEEIWDDEETESESE